MKYLYIIIMCLGLQFNGVAQATVFQLIEDRDIEQILANSDELIDLCILDDQNIYSKDEAAKILGSFFKTSNPNTCEQVHSGTSRKKGSGYLLGKLTSEEGNAYRVFVYTNEKNKIIELRFDKW